jgi:hypothetical protein
VSGTSKVLPSILITRQARYHAPRVGSSANGTAVSSNRRLSGADPTRARAFENADFCGTTTGTDAPHDRTPSISNRNNSRYPASAYNAIARTYYTTRRDGNNRDLC